MEPKKEEVVVDDESVLDKELEESINTIKKAGEVPQPKTEVKPEVQPQVEVKVEESSNPPVVEEPYKFKLPIPSKTKFESDESYEKRVELGDLIERRRLAKTEEQKQQLSAQISDTRKEMFNLGQKNIINPLNTVEGAPKVEIDEAKKADLERLKELGGATKEDIQEIIQQERIALDTKSTLEKFVERHPELKDADVREVFFDFVDSNYNWNGKVGKDLMTTLELAREAMFKPSETIQERVLKGANVQEKVNAMQFPGGTIAKPNYSPEMRKSIDELVATGMSEDKALELLSE